MGCDIHGYLEIRKDKDFWDNVCSIPDVRSYKIFARLANVRNYSERDQSIAEPKGLPSDIGIMARWESADWGEDGHSHSWLSFAELKNEKFDMPEWDGFIVYMAELAKQYGEDSVRIVFWFDN